jgi:hypothetical protein
MNGFPCDRMLFEDFDLKPFPSKTAGKMQACRPPANHDHIFQRILHSTLVPADSMTALSEFVRQIRTGAGSVCRPEPPIGQES